MRMPTGCGRGWCSTSEKSAQGLHGKAIADYDEALRLEPHNAEIYVCRGIEWEKDAEAALVEPETAMADFDQAVALDPKCGSAYIARARIWKRRRQFGEVVRNFTALIENVPDASDGHRYLARILATCNDAKTRDGQRALAEATRACDLTQWKDPDCLDTLAAAYAEAGDFPGAIKWQIKAIESLPPTRLRSYDQDVDFKGRLALYQSRKSCRE
jgi:tetratricopeptide (TPR) repeat protein